MRAAGPWGGASVGGDAAMMRSFGGFDGDPEPPMGGPIPGVGWPGTRPQAIPGLPEMSPEWGGMGAQVVRTRLLAVPGMELELCATYDFDVEAARLRVDVFARMETATVTVTAPAGDTRRLYDALLAPTLGDLTASLTHRSRIGLVPTLSPAGRMGATQAVLELPDVDVRVFHVGTMPWQAIAAAYDLKPGCEGTIEDVRHFIGAAAYGIIADEHTVDGVFRAKWRLGGFARSAPLSQTIEITRNGNPEDATLRGTLTLDRLDIVSIETDSNTGVDFVRLGGPATARATDVLLRTGEVVTQGIDSGPQATNWAVFTDLDAYPPTSPDPLMREFARRATADASTQLARPFTHPGASVEWGWTTPRLGWVGGATKHVMALGDVRILFT